MNHSVMVYKGLPSEAMELFVWLKKQGLLFERDWVWKTMPGSALIQVSFKKPEHATMFALRWA